MAEHRLQLVPAESRKQLSAQYHVVSACACVEQLLFNALDARASCVAARVNFAADSIDIQLIDDGSGISLQHLRLLGEK